MAKGFADYSNELQRCQSAINFVAFAEFYREWREMVAEGDRAFNYGGVPSSLNLSAYRVGHLIGRDPAFLDDPAFDPYGLDVSPGTNASRTGRTATDCASAGEYYGGLSGLLRRQGNPVRLAEGCCH